MTELKKSKLFWFIGSTVSALFILLILIRIDFFDTFHASPEKPVITAETMISNRDGWMNIFQNKKKIGYSHSIFKKEEGGYHLKETVYMRINTLGTIQDIHIDTQGRLQPDFSLSSFAFNIKSGLFDFSVNGTVSGELLSLQTQSAGETRTLDLEIEPKPFLMSGVFDAIAATKLNPGDEFRFNVFDPATMGQAPVLVHISGREKIRIMGQERISVRASMQFKGSTQEVWIGENGEILKEAGLLGITLVKTTKTDALAGIDPEPVQDLTQQASVATREKIDNPHRLQKLKMEISGINLNALQIDGGRQHLVGNLLTITKETLPKTNETMPMAPLHDDFKRFLQATPFIQSDHPEIKALSKRILQANDNLPAMGEKLVGWVFQNIQKRPVLSLPDALSTLENRVGDCNEHAVLLAALARSAGIPTKIETGLVYLKGRFYYHAWNSLYLGEWISADAVFGQIPADVTHIRMTSGDQKAQLDLLGVIGKIQLKILTVQE